MKQYERSVGVLHIKTRWNRFYFNKDGDFYSMGKR